MPRRGICQQQQRARRHAHQAARQLLCTCLNAYNSCCATEKEGQREEEPHHRNMQGVHAEKRCAWGVHACPVIASLEAVFVGLSVSSDLVPVGAASTALQAEAGTAAKETRLRPKQPAAEATPCPLPPSGHSFAAQSSLSSKPLYRQRPGSGDIERRL